MRVNLQLILIGIGIYSGICETRTFYCKKTWGSAGILINPKCIKFNRAWRQAVTIHYRRCEMPSEFRTTASRKHMSGRACVNVRIIIMYFQSNNRIRACLPCTHCMAASRFIIIIIMKSSDKHLHAIRHCFRGTVGACGLCCLIEIVTRRVRIKKRVH